MKKLLLLILCCITFYSCDIPISPEDKDMRGFELNPTSQNVNQLNDSVYILYIDTLQWQTLERIEAKTFQTKNTIKISWDAFSTKKAYYWYSGIRFEAPIINLSSYTDTYGKASTMLSVYRELLSDTIMVIGGYTWNDKTYIDFKYFIILAKN